MGLVRPGLLGLDWLGLHCWRSLGWGCEMRRGNSFGVLMSSLVTALVISPTLQQRFIFI